MSHATAPAWLTTVMQAGYIPYIATSRRLAPALNLQPFGVTPQVFYMEEPAHTPFMEAYLLSNSLGFKSPDLKMPNWVLIDCVLMQTAVVGFMKPVKDIPAGFLDYYRKDKCVEFDKLTHIPISGQISSIAAGGNSYVGISLFSVARDTGDERALGLYTKAMSLEVYRARATGTYCGISQYNNPAIRLHGRFTSRMEIYQPIVELHPKKDMTLIYTMHLDYDPHRLDEKPADKTPTFWMKANDRAAKERMIEGKKRGLTYFIAPPFQKGTGDDMMLPIIEEDKK